MVFRNRDSLGKVIIYGMFFFEFMILFFVFCGERELSFYFLMIFISVINIFMYRDRSY